MNNRIVYFDSLRFLATIAVVMLHISSMVYGNAERGSVDYWVGIAYNVPTRWAVPVFVMLSGALFLNPQKEINLKLLFGKYILRLMAVFLFWVLIYTYLLGPSLFWIKGIYPEPRHFTFLSDYTFHLWFLPMLIGVYILIPVLKVVAADEKAMGYFLVLWLVFSVLSFIPGVVAEMVNLLQVKMVLGYAGYFLLGYYLSITQFETGKLSKVLFLFLCLLLMMFVMIRLVPFAVSLLEPLSPNVILFSISVFLMAKRLSGRLNTNDRLKKVIAFVQDSLFGVYIIHLFIINLMYRPHFISNLSPVVSIPMFTIVVFVMSLFMIKILRRIPGIRYFCS
jgi:surface polysaccharide O-acyltransferase-like enzyme